jgi:hypothetical protein
MSMVPPTYGVQRIEALYETKHYIVVSVFLFAVQKLLVLITPLWLKLFYFSKANHIFS